MKFYVSRQQATGNRQQATDNSYHYDTIRKFFPSSHQPPATIATSHHSHQAP